MGESATRGGHRLARWAATALSAAGLLAGASAPPSSASPGWLPGAQLSGGEAFVASQAVGRDGETIVVWSQKIGTEYRIEARVRPPGGAFGAPTAVSPAGGTAESPQVAIDASGNALVVWHRAGYAESSSLPAGGSFEKAQVLSAEGESVEALQLTFGSGGEAVVLWSASTGTFPSFSGRLEACARPAGASAFGPAQPLETIGPYNPIESIDRLTPASLSHDAHGNVQAVVEREEARTSPTGPAQFEIQLFSRPSGGPFGAATAVASAATPSFPPNEVVASPGLAVDPNGDAMVTWQRRNTAEESTKIEARTMPAGGAFGSAQIVSSRKRSSEPQGALDAAGNATVTWVGEDPASKKQVVLEADRPAGGAFASPQSVSDPSLETGPNGPQSPVVGSSPNGETLIAWVRYPEPSRVEAAARPPGGIFGPQQPISPDGKSGTVEEPKLAFDDAGDAVAAWRSNFVVEWAAHDATAPLLGGLSIPASAVVGVPVAFSVSPFDTFSPLGATTWSFGDGAGATGTVVSHIFTRPGTFAIALSSADTLGNATSATGSIAVTAAATRPPKLEHLRQSNRRWREGSALARLAAKRRAPLGTTFSFTLDQAARVTLTFAQPARGRSVKGHCVAATRRNRKAHRCTRVLSRGAISLAAHAGANKILFQGRLSSARKLRPGTYTVLVTAGNAAGQRSATSRLTTTVLR